MTTPKLPPITLQQVLREKYRRSFYAFIRDFWAVVEPAEPYVDSLHIKALADHAQAVIEGKIRDLSVEIPPGYAKSLVYAVFLPAWAWGAAGMPWLRMGFSTYANSLTVRDSRRCRDLIQCPQYQELWGDKVVLKTDGGNRQDYYETTAKGFRWATSVGGAATGHRFHIFIGDDLLNAKEAQSKATRTEMLEHLRAMASRGVNQKTYRRILIGQRLHEEDAGGWARSHGFVALCLPTEFDPTRACTTPLGFKDWRTAKGELLFPARFGEAEVAKAKNELGEYGYSAQHQQLPVPADGGVLKRAWFRTYSEPTKPKFLTVIQSWDTAFTTNEQNDTSACTTWGIGEHGAYLLDCWTGRLEMPQLLDQIRTLAARWKPSTVLIEAKANGLSIIQTLNQDASFPFHIEGIKPLLDKNSRAHAAAPFVCRGNCWLPSDQGFTADFLAQTDIFPAGKVRDLADSAVQALIWIDATYTFQRSLFDYETVETGRTTEALPAKNQFFADEPDEPAESGSW